MDPSTTLRVNHNKIMNKIYDKKTVEQKWYQFWEESGFFKPEINPSGKPYTIVLPLPNASGRMHTGNVLMIAIEDLLIRWHRMKGEAALWVPGTDHAGTETQITYERDLKKEGKSRFSFDRDTLYQNIHDFVFENKHLIEGQIRAMGASIDWSRYKFTLDPDSIDTVYNTFIKMASENLIYKDDYMVNYCPTCGTTYADIEVDHEEVKDPFITMKYGPFTIATVRPETKFRDTALAVNPNDKRYKKYIGKTLEIPGLLGSLNMTVIGDPEVDPKFGTGIMKVTPAHDPHDFELGKKYNLPITPVIDLNGRVDFSWFLNQKNIDPKYKARAEKYHGVKAGEVRKIMTEDLKEEGLLVKIDENYTHSVPVCKAGHPIEPMVLPNWFVKVKTLKETAHEVVKNGQVKIYPKWREVTYHRWMENMHDWAISRQNVWGIRIPAWYEVSKNPNLQVTFLDKNKEVTTSKISDLLKDHSLDEIKKGLQKIIAPAQCVYEISKTPPGDSYLQETDTFDTWYSSSQWPLITLGYPSGEDFKKFYPTDVMETAWEILSKWVSRMIMFGIYLTGKPPFHSVYLHGVVRALDGRKMSKSLGNVINPEEYTQNFGTDALRMGLVLGNGNGKDFAFPRDRVIAIKHFNNKIWNMTRFILMMKEEYGKEIPSFSKKLTLKPEDKEMIKQLNTLIKSVNSSLEKFRFADGGEAIYQFVWHEIADKYIESVKSREDKDVALASLIYVFRTSLELLHPFMPFITEELWQKLPHDGKSIMITKWPEIKKID